MAKKKRIETVMEVDVWQQPSGSYCAEVPGVKDALIIGRSIDAIGELMQAIASHASQKTKEALLDGREVTRS